MNKSQLWQPIETAPKDRLILLYFPARPHAMAIIRVGFREDAPRRPTHWMPLPEPPDGA